MSVLMIGLLSSFGAFLLIAVGVLVFINMYGNKIKREVREGIFVSKEMKNKLKSEGKSVKEFQNELKFKREKLLEERKESGDDSNSYLEELKSLEG